MEKELKVNGMMCVNCQKHVHDALAAMAGVSAVRDVDVLWKTFDIHKNCS